MPLSFPPEIWTYIVKLALEREWDLNRFHRPIRNADSVQGFAEASSLFKDIVQSLKEDELFATCVCFADLEIDDDQKSRVRHLEITDDGGLQRINNRDKERHFTSSFWAKLEGFTLLTSLSISQYKAPVDLMITLQKHPMARTLEYLDIQGPFFPSLWIRTTTINMELFYAYFPNLLRLRLSDPSAEVVTLGDTEMIAVARVLTGCPKLKLLSFHMGLDNATAWREQVATHTSSIEHLLSTEGYERQISDCPLCFERYDHQSVIQKENLATRLFATRLPELEEIRWASFWRAPCRGETCQRGTKIRREDGNIILSRDDRQEE